MLNIIEKLKEEDLLKNNKKFLYSLLEDSKLEFSRANHKWFKLIESIKEFYIKENDEKNVSQYKMKMNSQFIISLEIFKKVFKSNG